MVRTRRRLSVTPLIDVIFLLLLFFMLTSTFSKFAEIELSTTGAGRQTDAETVAPLFLQLGEATLTVNGEPFGLNGLEASLTGRIDTELVQPIIVSLRRDVTAQRLTDLLVVLRSIPTARVTVLGDA